MVTFFLPVVLPLPECSHYPALPYIVDNNVLKRVNDCMEIGVLFDSKISFDSHIGNIVCEANRAVGFVLRNCKEFLNILAIRSVYLNLVNTKLKYCVLVYVKYITALQSVKKILKFSHLKKIFRSFLYYKKHNVCPIQNNNYNCELWVKLRKFEKKSEYLLSN